VKHFELRKARRPYFRLNFGEERLTASWWLVRVGFFLIVPVGSPHPFSFSRQAPIPPVLSSFDSILDNVEPKHDVHPYILTIG